MLEVNHIEYRFSNATIRTDFCVNSGKSVALMGPSGSGKTTILNIIAGFIRPEKGDVHFDTQSLLNLKPAHRPLTYLFQAHNLFPHLSVWQNLAIGIDPGLKISIKQKDEIQKALEWVSLDSFSDRLPTDMSGGQQQRVALARCLLRRTPILLMDEPFSALDQSLRDEMTDLIKRLQQQQNLTLVFATHQETDARALDAKIITVTG